jgi:hypothetical protein
VSFDYLANLIKLKKNTFLGMGGGNEEKGVLINEKPNQEVRERKKVGIHWSIQRKGLRNPSHSGKIGATAYPC